MSIANKVLGAAAAILVAANIASAQTVSVRYTEIFSQECAPRSRIELLGKKLPYSSDLLATREACENIDFVKFRAEALPFTWGPVSAGGAAQWSHLGIDAPKDYVDEHGEAGFFVRVQGTPTDGGYAKFDIRYFPETKVVDGYTLLDTERFFADVLWSNNLETDIMKARPGIDYKPSKNISVGLEASLKGPADDLKVDYTAARITITLP